MNSTQNIPYSPDFFLASMILKLCQNEEVDVSSLRILIYEYNQKNNPLNLNRIYEEEDGCFTLHYAIKRKNVHLVSLLLENGADPNKHILKFNGIAGNHIEDMYYHCRRFMKYSPLMLALQVGASDIFNAIIHHPKFALPFVRQEELTFLLNQTLETILDKWALPDLMDEPEPKELLIYAEWIAYLLNNGADLAVYLNSLSVKRFEEIFSFVTLAKLFASKCNLFFSPNLNSTFAMLLYGQENKSIDDYYRILILSLLGMEDPQTESLKGYCCLAIIQLKQSKIDRIFPSNPVSFEKVREKFSKEFEKYILGYLREFLNLIPKLKPVQCDEEWLYKLSPDLYSIDMDSQFNCSYFTFVLERNKDPQINHKAIAFFMKSGYYRYHAEIAVNKAQEIKSLIEIEKQQAYQLISNTIPKDNKFLSNASNPDSLNASTTLNESYQQIEKKYSNNYQKIFKNCNEEIIYSIDSSLCWNKQSLNIKTMDEYFRLRDLFMRQYADPAAHFLINEERFQPLAKKNNLKRFSEILAKTILDLSDVEELYQFANQLSVDEWVTQVNIENDKEYIKSIMMKPDELMHIMSIEAAYRLAMFFEVSDPSESLKWLKCLARRGDLRVQKLLYLLQLRSAFLDNPAREKQVIADLWGKAKKGELAAFLALDAHDSDQARYNCATFKFRFANFVYEDLNKVQKVRQDGLNYLLNLGKSKFVKTKDDNYFAILACEFLKGQLSNRVKKDRVIADAQYGLALLLSLETKPSLEDDATIEAFFHLAITNGNPLAEKDLFIFMLKIEAGLERVLNAALENNLVALTVLKENENTSLSIKLTLAKCYLLIESEPNVKLAGDLFLKLFIWEGKYQAVTNFLVSAKSLHAFKVQTYVGMHYIEAARYNEAKFWLSIAAKQAHAPAIKELKLLQSFSQADFTSLLLDDCDPPRFAKSDEQIGHAVLMKNAEGKEVAMQYELKSVRPLEHITVSEREGVKRYRAKTPNGTNMFASRFLDFEMHDGQQQTQGKIAFFSPTPDQEPLLDKVNEPPIFKDNIENDTLNMLKGGNEVTIDHQSVIERNKVKIRFPDQNTVMGRSAKDAYQAFYDTFKDKLTPDIERVIKYALELKHRLGSHHDSSNQQYRFEWTHAERFVLTPLSKDPQQKNNLGAAPSWANNEMQTLGDIAKWFAIHQSNSFLKMKPTFQMLLGTDIIKKIDLEVTIGENNCFIKFHQTVNPFCIKPNFRTRSDIAQGTAITYNLIHHLPVLFEEIVNNKQDESLNTTTTTNSSTINSLMSKKRKHEVVVAENKKIKSLDAMNDVEEFKEEECATTNNKKNMKTEKTIATTTFATFQEEDKQDFENGQVILSKRRVWGWF